MTRTGDCPDLETLAALIDGRLPSPAAVRVRGHVADCAACFTTVRGTLDVLGREAAATAGGEGPGSAGTPGAVRPFRRVSERVLPWTAAVAAALLLFAGLRFFRAAHDDGVAGLVAAVGERRLVEPRLTGGFRYAPIRSPERGPAGLDRLDPGDWQLVGAAARVREAAERGAAGPDSAHLLGLAHLLVGNRDSAVQTLESAVRSRPDDARALSDLAAAYLVRSDAARSAGDIVRAIDAARHALALDPRCLEARFNFALALEKQIAAGASGSAGTGGGEAATPDQGRAIEAWQEYLRHDADSPWAGEARRRLAALQRQGDRLPVPPSPEAIAAAARQGDLDRVARLLGAGPRVGREVLERRLLPAWAAAERDAEGDAGAETLAAAATLARGVERVSGDRLEVESVEAIEGAPPRGAARRAVADGLLRYEQALAADDKGDLQAAAPAFAAARDLLERGRNPLRWSAALHVAIADYYGGRGQEARGLVDRVAAGLAARPYPSLLARVRWMQGLLGAVAGDLSHSLLDYEAALALFQDTRELDGVASAQFLIAENLDLLGDRDEAWRHRATALGLASRADADHRRSILLNATFAALDQDRPWAALTLHEPLFAPWSAGDPGARSEAYQTRARILAASGDADGALDDLAAADRALAEVVDPDLRRRFAAEVAEGRGTTLLGRDPEGAVAPLRQASEYFASVGSTSRLAALRLDLGRAHEAAGAYDDAESDYIGGIASLEETYAHLLLDPQRVSFLDRTWLLFGAIIRLEAERRGRPDLAFAYAERAREAELLRPEACASSTAEAPAGAPDAEDVARRLPGGVTLVYLLVVPDRLLRWVFRDGRVDFRPQGVADGEIDRLVRAVHRAAADGDETSFRDASEALYDLLIRPIEPLLPVTGEIRIVPDRLLDGVPFAALLDRDTHEYLMERHATGMAPTAASLVSSCDRGGHPAAGAALLAVGDPSFDRVAHADLAPLPGAEEEARTVASLYPDSRLLVGGEATAARFLSGTAAAEIIHFAGHALANDRYPLLSALVLAPDPGRGDSGLVTALDRQQAAFARARLVVLGTCRAAGGAAGHPGSAFSLARPFLARGVPEIVGTLWAVRDREAGSILVDLHREYLRGRSAVEGLRAAQLAALHGRDAAARSPLAWGAYVVNGTILRSGDPL